MSLDTEEKLRRMLASSPPALREIAVVVISHSALSQTFAFWPEPYPGTVVTPLGTLAVRYAPMQMELAGSEANLDQVYNITLDTTDVQDIFREEMDRVPIGSLEKVQIGFYSFVSDDLTDPQAATSLEVQTVSYKKGVATINATSPRYNVLSTGELYAPRDVPMLRGFT